MYLYYSGNCLLQSQPNSVEQQQNVYMWYAPIGQVAQTGSAHHQPRLLAAVA